MLTEPSRGSMKKLKRVEIQQYMSPFFWQIKRLVLLFLNHLLFTLFLCLSPYSSYLFFLAKPHQKYCQRIFLQFSYSPVSTPVIFPIFLLQSLLQNSHSSTKLPNKKHKFFSLINSVYYFYKYKK